MSPSKTPAPLYLVVHPTSPAHRALKMGLTNREIAVASLAARGLRNEQIAAETGLARNSVKVYLSRILRRLGVPDRYALMRWWIENVEQFGECSKCTLYRAHSLGSVDVLEPVFLKTAA